MKLIFLLIIQLTTANWTPIKEVPYELESLIKSASINQNDKEYLNNLKISLANVYHYYNSLNKKEFYYLFKISTYKYILREKPETRIPGNYYSSSYLNQFIRNKPPTHLAEFPQWLWSALSKDIDLIIRDRNYLKYTKAKKNGAMSTDLNVLDKKIKLILPWLISLKIQSSEELSIFMQEHYLNILKHAAINMRIFSMLKEKKLANSPEKFNLSPFLNFNIKKQKNSNSDDIEIISNIIEDVTKDSLPKGSSEWNLESEEFLPKNEANDLPVPVDDWLNEY